MKENIHYYVFGKETGFDFYTKTKGSVNIQITPICCVWSIVWTSECKSKLRTYLQDASMSTLKVLLGSESVQIPIPMIGFHLKNHPNKIFFQRISITKHIGLKQINYLSFLKF